MPTKPLTRHITRIFREADITDKEYGFTWYSRAQELSRELDPDNPRRGAAVIAVLSPMLSWPRNVKLARAAYAGEPLTCLGKNAEKARAILAGADPATIVSGDKVTAFWLAICDPFDPRAVAVDRHAVSIAHGRVMPDSERAKYTRGKRYLEVVRLYQNAARIISKETDKQWSPAQVQAATWVYWRKTYATAYHGES